MAVDEKMAERVRAALKGRRGITEKKMFGGLSFLLHGNMCVGIVRDDLTVRVGPDAYEESLTRPHARPMDFTGRPMKGYVFVAKPGFRTAASLKKWVDRGIDFAKTLPAK